ncbi:uncharacterized protein [Periplaneta americana]|uniref:uncharacterized protein n=1 Tax=Periplaneta americana TaxID=6978 RepID=UPI0037E8B729
MRPALTVAALVLALQTALCARAEVLNVLGGVHDALFAPEMTRAVQSVPFDPDAALRDRQGYQARFGPRGTALVDKLGRGYSREQLVRLGAVTP